MYIAIADGVGWATSSGVFDCIVEGTRIYLEGTDRACLRRIYRSLDEEAQNFIVLKSVEVECFNKFYFCCKKAMLDFSGSNAAHEIPSDHLEGILWNWDEVLKLMRHDPRYRMGEY
ncbi:hypothetical protein C1X59_14585 [Pseudomonas sp. FW215-R2]|nr:hypothetical protein C1X59_14585 [Pseudomonas sp. FW215-R2]PMX09339.1 hypothetical protein C1X60_14370 [Pseudomonas sp. FW215-L1]PMX22692.1 hypothetical protein C1X57_14280 [Pseudomonas sp. FW215-E1]PNA30316.1 hypothetical protein C1X58_10940 [Pseudomonas sp. FW215-R4]